MDTKLKLAGLMFLASTIGMTALAQSGADIYKTKCQMCHGAAGLADSGTGKAMKVKPATDPEVKKMSEAQMADAEKGHGQDAALQRQAHRCADHGRGSLLPDVREVRN